MRDDICGPRVIHRRVHYRILYFFYGQQVVVLSHLITKEGKVPDSEIDRALSHKMLFETDSETHTASDIEEEAMPKRKPTSDALEILDAMIGDDAELRALIEEERVNAQVAREIYDLRTSRGLTQKQLAERVGTTQSVIARLEDADYEGHSLRMLRRIADALGARLSVHLVPEEALTSKAG